MQYSTALNIAVLALACWRIASLIANEDGPWNVLERMRFFIGVRYTDNAKRYGSNTFADGAMCVWCNSIWVGTLLTILYLALGYIAVLTLLPLALSTAAIVVEEFINGKS